MSVPKTALVLFKAFGVAMLISSTVRTTEGSRYARSESRIVDGLNVTPANKYPMMVSFQKDESHLCGGTILNKHYVMTAAHCAFLVDHSYNQSKYTVVAGLYYQKDPDDDVSQYVQRFDITKVYLHENYNDKVKGSYANDIAVLRLDRPIVWNDHVAPTNLPPPAWTVLRDNEINALAVGWGYGRNRKWPYDPIRPLQEIELPLVTTESCQRAWGRGEEAVTDFHLCQRIIEGSGSCKGDSGGPLFVYDEATDKHVQVGLCSFGEVDCGSSNDSRPSAWTKVSYYTTWIREIIRECDERRQVTQTTAKPQETDPARSESRIVDGWNVTPVNKYPMMIQLMNRGKPACGGTILNKYHVLTAAHCVDNIYNYDWEDNYTVIAGVYHLGDPDPQYLQNVSLLKVYYHPRYSDHKKGNHANDIAVVRVRQPFIWNDHVAPTNIIQPGWDVLKDREINAIAVGWGHGRNRTNPFEPTRPLQEVTIPLVTTATCQRMWQDSPINEDDVCGEVIGRADVCHGDSGGPLFIYNEADDSYSQIGIVSWGEGSCGRLNENQSRPAVYTKISSYAFWLTQLIRDCGDKPAPGGIVPPGR